MSNSRIATPGWNIAHALKDLSDSHFPDARKIILVQDNSLRAAGVRSDPLNTHKPASLQMSRRGEWHYSRKHGSWLNMAESELGVRSNQYLYRLSLS